MTVPETGQTEARALYAAATGTERDALELAPEVAQRLAAACDTLVGELGKLTAAGHLVTEVRGFPNLPTGRGLARGFADKGVQYLDTVTALQQTALLLKAAYLAAGRQFADADAAHRAALELIAADLELS